MSNDKHPGLPLLIMVSLTDQSIEKLKLALGDFKFSNKTLKPEQYLHHVTLAFKPTFSEYNKIRSVGERGDPVIIKCKRRCWSESHKAEAIKVEVTCNGKELFVQSGFPHITVSTEGKPPVAGKTLFEKSSSDYDREDYIHDLECEVFESVLDGIISYKE